MRESIDVSIPNTDKFIEYFCMISKAKNNQKYVAKWRYLRFIRGFKSSQEAIEYNIIKDRPDWKVIIFLYFMTNTKMNIDSHRVIISGSKEILRCLNIVDDKFWDACRELDIKDETIKYSQIIKALIFLGKKKFNEITYEDLKEMYKEGFYYAVGRSASVPTLIESIMNKINKRGMSKRISQALHKETYFGEIKGDARQTVTDFLNKEYRNKGYDISSPLYSIRMFFKWLKENNKGIKSIDEITSILWNDYKEEVKLLNISDRTKEVRINLTSKFLQWLQENNIVSEKNIEFGDQYNKSVECKPRMLESREHFKLIARSIINFQPKDEYEWVTIKYLTVILATGLRLSEAKWLSVGSVRSNIDCVGEVTLEVKDKTKVVNKTTSIMPWGIEAINELENRLEKNPGIELYNEKTNKYVYTLFQYEGRLISNDKIYRVLNSIIKKIEFRDEEGRMIDYANIKLHSFRHQKFNDIFDVSGGNIFAVKMDSNHTSTDMARSYTKQGEKKKKIEIIRGIEEKRVDGKRVNLLKEMMNVNIPEDKYVETVAIMNCNATINLGSNKNISRYLGFGYCVGECNKLQRFCESCDFFYTCKDFMDELKERYAKNFLLIKSRTSIEGNNVYFLKEDKEIIKGLKFQEKWLLELGIKKEEIDFLKYKYVK